MHLCAANCCDKKSDTVERVNGCVEQCSIPLHQAQSHVQKELSNFQVYKMTISFDKPLYVSLFTGDVAAMHHGVSRSY